MPLKNSFNQNQEPGTKNQVFFFFIFLVLAPWFMVPAFSATAENAMVVTQHPLATEAALEILKQGGNAADAAITAQLVLNVVEPQSSGLGGGGFFIYYDHLKRSVTSLDGRETAPSSATPEMFSKIFFKDGKLLPFFPDRITGGLAVGVPGTPALIQKIFERFSSATLTFEQLVKPASNLAEAGVPVSKPLAEKLAEHAERLKQFPETRRVFFNDRGLPLEEGDALVQSDLAKTLKLLAQTKNIFYEGEVADAIAKAVSESPVKPAQLTAADLKKYMAIERAPVYGNYRGLDFMAPGPPTSGGVTLMENLNILETFSLGEIGWDAQALHYLNESQKLSFQDRGTLGDPSFSELQTVKLSSDEFGKERAQKIQSQKAIRMEAAMAEDGKQTTHISIADRFGNLVSWTSTIEAPFGSGITVPGYGFLLNNELTDFDPEPRDTRGNLKPNSAAPGKRPLSSMTPVLVFKNGRPSMILGSPGGTTIIGTLLNVIVNHIDFGMTCEDAVAKPRLIQRGGKMEMEPELYDHPLIRLQLELWGHDAEKVETIGNAQVICFDGSRQEIVGVADARGIGKADGY